MKTTWLNDNIKPLLAVIIIVLGFGYFYMCSLRDIKPDPQILIAFVASIAGVTGYFFGSSSGSSKKDDIIGDTFTQPAQTVTNADNVNQIVKP